MLLENLEGKKLDMLRSNSSAFIVNFSLLWNADEKGQQLSGHFFKLLETFF